MPIDVIDPDALANPEALRAGKEAVVASSPAAGKPRYSKPSPGKRSLATAHMQQPAMRTSTEVARSIHRSAADGTQAWRLVGW